MSWGSTWGSSDKSWRGGQAASDQTRKGDIGQLGRKSGKRASDTIGAKENPAGVNLRGLVGTSMSIAGEGGEKQEQSEEEAEG